MKPHSEDNRVDIASLILARDQTLQMQNEIRHRFLNGLPMVSKLVAVNLSFPEHRSTLLITEPRFSEGPLQKSSSFTRCISNQHLEHLGQIGVRCLGEQFVPKQQCPRGCRCITDKISIQAIEGCDPILALSRCINLFLELLITRIEIGILFDRHIVINIPFEHTAVPNTMSQHFDVIETPHFVLHHLISHDAVFAFGPCPSTDHCSLSMWIASQLWSKLFCFLDRNRFVE